MITIEFTNKSIEVSGHAGYAAYGEDIVCSAVSVLSQTLAESMSRLTETEITECTMADGYLLIAYEAIDKGGELLINAFKTGIEGVMNSYPGYIEVEHTDYKCME